MSDEELTIRAVLEQVRSKFGVPRLAAIVVSDQKVIGHGVVGGEINTLPENEEWPLGRCTALFTGTLAAILVEAKKLEWNWNLKTCLGSVVEYIDPSLREITFTDLLRHTSGLFLSSKIMKYIYETNDKPKLARLKVTRMLLNEPRHKNNTASFSEANLLIAGTIIETICEQRFEDIITEKIFKPLYMSKASFRDLNKSGHILNPDYSITTLAPVDFTSPELLGPATRIIAPLHEVATLAQVHLQGLRTWAPRSTNKSVHHNFLPAHLIRTIHSFGPKSDKHAKWTLCGLHRDKRDDKFGGHVSSLQHGGKTEPSAARIFIYPYLNRAIIAAANLGGGDADVSGDRALDEAASILLEALEARASNNTHHQAHLQFWTNVQ